MDYHTLSSIACLSFASCMFTVDLDAPVLQDHFREPAPKVETVKLAEAAPEIAAEPIHARPAPKVDLQIAVAKDSCECDPACPCKQPTQVASPPTRATNGPPFARGVYYQQGIVYECRNGELHWPIGYQPGEAGRSTRNFTTPANAPVCLRRPLGRWWIVPSALSTMASDNARPFAMKVSSVVVHPSSQRSANPSTPAVTRSSYGYSVPSGYRPSPCSGGRCSLPR